MAVTKRKRKGKPRPGQRGTYYQAEVYVGGIRVASESHDTQAAAAVWHDKTKKIWEQGRGAIGDMTLADVIQRYRENDMNVLANQTHLHYSRCLGIIGEAPIARVRMTELTGFKVNEFLDWLIGSKHAATKCRKSFRAELMVLKVILGFYRDRLDDQFVSPVTKKHGKLALYKGPLPPRRKDYFIPAEDAIRWLECLGRQRDPVYADLAMFQLVMGTRIGEAAALCWDAVDLAKGTVEIRRTMEWRNKDRSYLGEPAEKTKTAESLRTIPLPPVIVELLATARARFPDSREVFRNRAGVLPVYGSIQDAYNRAFEKAKLPWTATHILRHTNATLARSQVRTEDVSANLGHSTLKQTETYVHHMGTNGVPEAVAKLLANGDNHVPDHVTDESIAKKAVKFGGLRLV